MKGSFRLALLAAAALACVYQRCAAEDRATATGVAEKPSSEEDAATPKGAKVAPLGSPKDPGPPKKLTVAPLGAPKKPAAAALGKPGKPKFALKRTGVGTAGAAAPDRAAEVERLIDAYHRIAISYADRMVLAKTPDEITEAKRHEPSARALRPIVRLIAEVVAVDPSDEPALDALLFLSKYVGVPIIDETLAQAVFEDGTEGVDPNALILEHHADNPEIAKALRSWPKSPQTDRFMMALFERTYSPKVRAASGIRLINSLQQAEETELAEKLAGAMVDDRYLDGVPITTRPTGPTARDWAAGKLREIRLLSVGKELPEVSGETLKGDVAAISSYRGKVLVLDVWATWCGPCVAMIPHQRELVERYGDEPFALLSVSCDADRETLDEFLEERDMPWDHWWVGQDSELQKSLNIRAFPTIFVLDAEGVIRFKNIHGEELDAAIASLIGETTSPRQEPGG